jgi:Uma2 family endonuclease
MSAQAFPRLTVEEYLNLERAAETKHEYYKGRMYAMAGGKLCARPAGFKPDTMRLQALDDTPCVVATTELLVRTSPDGLHAYPDIVVVCGEAKLADEHRDILLNPTLIIEVLYNTRHEWDLIRQENAYSCFEGRV